MREAGGEERMIENCHRVINCYASFHLKSMREAAMSEPLYPDGSHSCLGKSNRLGYPKGSTVNPSHRRGHEERRHTLKGRKWQETKNIVRLSNWNTEAYQPVL
jgi:monomeric isocitrate dehydrogenase